MDGVMVVALPAGTLHYARSLSARFDRRHPRADRMNLAALVFALHNFAENTLALDAAAAKRISPRADSEEHDEDEETAAAIALFATSDEQLAAALSPSKKLLVALFTSPQVDADAAKWITKRVARNFESTDSVDSLIMTTLNHVSGLFRSALVRAVESHVDDQFATFAASVQHLFGDSTQASTLNGMFGFYYRYHASDLAESSASKHNGDADEGIVHQPGSSELHSLGVPPTAPPASRAPPARPPGKLSRLPSRIVVNSSVLLSTWSLLAVPRVTPDHGNATTIKKKKHKKSKKKSKNAVLDHAEPRVFQRVIGFSDCSKSVAPTLQPQCSSSTVASEHIGRLVGTLLDSVAKSAVADQTNKPDESSHLRQLTWRNPPLSTGTITNSPSASVGSSASQPSELVAWQRGHGIVYCLVPLHVAHRVADNLGVRLQVDKMLATMEQTVRAMLSALVK